MSTKTNVNALVFRRKLVHGLLIAFCSLVAITAFYPFFVMIVSSTHDNFNIVSKINLLPGSHLLAN